MFGIASQKGVSLPHILRNRYEDLDREDDELAINGIKSHPVQPYDPHRSIMLPHISQKSKRTMPRHIYNVYSINQAEGSMLEAIEIYKRRSKVTHPSDEKKGGMYDVIFQSVPCPTPVERPVTVITEVESERAEQNPEKSDEKQTVAQTKVVRQSTKLLPVTISLQKRLEKLARHKTNKMKKQSTKQMTKETPKLAVESGKKVVLNEIKGEHTTRHLHYTFTSKLLPKIKKYPDKTGLSYQLLEIPSQLSKPDKKPRSMFSRSDYDMFQHAKFGNAKDPRLSIVEGPNSHVNAVWDYNKFLYLNAKI